MKPASFVAGLLAAVVAAIVAASAPADDALHRVTFADESREKRTVEGKLLVEAQDGGILLQARDGRLWNVTPKNLASREKTGDEFKPFDADELAERLKKEFGDGFEVTQTRRFVLCSNAGKPYTEWCGRLFERLMTAFLKQWSARELGLSEPAAPLVALVFADRKQFAKYAEAELGEGSSSSLGYYSIRSNRIVLFDLTAAPNAPPARSVREVVRKLGRSPFNAATVVHEATHQIAFNCGMHARYADNPLWLTEGMAMYFEPPDLASPTGWTRPGKVNSFRIGRFRRLLQNGGKAGSLKSLVTSDKRLADPKTAVDAYAEAWALTYFLIRTQRKEYEAYLKSVAGKPRLIWGDADARLKEFERAFGDVDRLEANLRKYFANPRLR